MNLSRVVDRLRTRTAAFAHDVVMVQVAWVAAFWLRFNFEPIPEPYLAAALSALPAVVVVQAVVNWRVGLYRGVWRFASLPDLLRILKAICIGVAVTAMVLFTWTRLQDLPRSTFALHGLLLLLLLGGPRLAYRWLKDRGLYVAARGRRALVVGAGRAGEMLVRDLLRNPQAGIVPVGFIDDDIVKKGREIHGVRVLGNAQKILRLSQRMDLDLVVLAIPSATPAQLRRILERCEEAGLPVQTLPSLQDLPHGRATAQSLREIAIEDLLGREPVSLDWVAIRHGIGEGVVMVTGGGGSIGSELCRQIAALQPAKLVVADNSEFNLYRIEQRLSRRCPELSLRAVLLDVCDAAAVDHAMQSFAPTVVLHAAAFKHVPLLETQARQAVRNNVMGTRTVADAAHRHGVGRFVLISTDKAVNPTNVMGASKRLAEVYCQNLNARSATRFITVRFGNVLDSAGSVVPLFREQIAMGGPVTVTHPEMRRYFMTIPEACELILQSAAVGEGGEVFVLDMGEPVSIAYLARQMIRLAGKQPDEDIAIEYVGLRPGEKLFEELFHPNEALRRSQHAKLLLARHRAVDWERFQQDLDDLAAACADFDQERVMQALYALVPEFAHTGGGPQAADAGEVVPIERARSPGAGPSVA
jgi:FlaA1/EpsC-like NDP-sugar epimerase